MLDGRLEKTMSQSSGGVIGWTTMSRTDAGIFPVSFQAQASEKDLPADRSDAAIAVISLVRLRVFALYVALAITGACVSGYLATALMP